MGLSENDFISIRLDDGFLYCTSQNFSVSQTLQLRVLSKDLLFLKGSTQPNTQQKKFYCATEMLVTHQKQKRSEEQSDLNVLFVENMTSLLNKHSLRFFLEL